MRPPTPHLCWQWPGNYRSGLLIAVGEEGPAAAAAPSQDSYVRRVTGHAGCTWTRGAPAVALALASCWGRGTSEAFVSLLAMPFPIFPVTDFARDEERPTIGSAHFPKRSDVTMR